MYRGYIYYIPIVSVVKERLLACDKCRTGKKLGRKEYNNIRRIQIRKMRNREFPHDVVIEDFDPEEVKYGRKIVLLVLAMIFGISMVYCAVGIAMSLSVFDPSGIFLVSLMFVVGLLPAVSAVKSVLLAYQQKKIFSSTRFDYNEKY
jgi:hypothetical protein